jgi:hypothetical protein
MMKNHFNDGRELLSTITNGSAYNRQAIHIEDCDEVVVILIESDENLQYFDTVLTRIIF